MHAARLGTLHTTSMLRSRFNVTRFKSRYVVRPWRLNDVEFSVTLVTFSLFAVFRTLFHMMGSQASDWKAFVTISS